jgi:hypothetical protein
LRVSALVKTVIGVAEIDCTREREKVLLDGPEQHNMFSGWVVLGMA